MIESNLPIQVLMALEITHQLNDHGRLYFRVLISEEEQRNFLRNDYFNETVFVYDARGKTPRLLFCGKIESVECEKEGQVLFADIWVMSYTIALDRGKRSRSFQNPSMTFEKVVRQVIDGLSARYRWNVRDRATNQAYFQYLESDWEFLVRLASRFNCPLQVNCATNVSDFHFGVRRGREQVLNEAEIVESGFSRDYYTNGGYVAGHDRGDYRYLKVRHLEFWEIGDFVQFQSQRFTVCGRVIRFEEGRLVFVDTAWRVGIASSSNAL